MKKALFLLVLVFCLSLDSYAEDNYPDDDISVQRSEISSSYNLRKGYWGFGFFSYDGVEQYGLSFGGYCFNGIGLGMNCRSNWKFSDNQSTYNADFLLNYSFGAYTNNDDVMFLITPEIGPSLGSRYIYENGKAKEKYYIDGFLGIKATVVYKKLILSAGYHIWAPKWKFGKKEKADGFYAQIGFDI